MSMVNLVDVNFHSFEALNDAFELQFFEGFIFTPLILVLVISKYETFV